MNNQYSNKISELQNNLNQKEKSLIHIIFENDMLKEKLKEFKWNIYFKIFVSTLSLIPLSKLLYISIYNGLGTISTEIILNIGILIYLLLLNISEKTFIYNFKVKNNILTELKNSNKKINILQTMIENSNNELTKLEIKQEEFEEQFSEIVRLEEEQEVLGNQLEELKENNDAIELVKETIGIAYEKLKENINPEFNKKLSENISKITNGKYNNILFNDEQGLIVELPNGNYISADRLSIGTIDQIYLSLRLAIIDEITNEKLPIILDEAFAYFDDIRLENIMLFLSKKFKDRQIIIFTCTTRELRILQNNNIEFNFIEL